MINQNKTGNLNYLIDPTFKNVNRQFVSSFENEEDTIYFSKYYTRTVEIKDYNVVVVGKSFYNVPVKSRKETHEK